MVLPMPSGSKITESLIAIRYFTLMNLLQWLTTIDYDGIGIVEKKINLTESPRYLKKEIKRLTKSRNEFKSRNKEKYLEVNKLKGRNNELSDSRNHWKTRAIELEDHSRNIESALKQSKKEAEQERENRLVLSSEIEQLKKKLTIWRSSFQNRESLPNDTGSPP
jgi:chromosome segregation ATPase